MLFQSINACCRRRNARRASALSAYAYRAETIRSNTSNASRCRATGQHVPEGYAEICRCIFESLALRYRQVAGYLKEMASFPIDTLHIIGGGSRNDVLNQYTGDDDGRVGRSMNELMTTTVEFLLQSISYVGNNNYRKQLPINY